MRTNLKDIFTQIDRLNKKEQLEVFNYLEQRFQKELDADKIQYNESDYENLLQYITDNSYQECKRPLGEFRGIAPNLLEGQDAQEWVNQQRDQWAERGSGGQQSELR
ncbi:hypothetical protein BJP34_15445 [Moorena producens PAL-8-15-08-1]|uniref:DUF2281 domain-containing protein n=1 Tax=Moorena producens PAL-8-15-08-1 TaxID=1458985 RepID=A0A1D8TSL6_9CYAN|nr:hypothetical protein [Moorena producens]AOX00652.1 hypothetical protein BJP34_15445 [Moorena producens PAL-8-15-08-1]